MSPLDTPVGRPPRVQVTVNQHCQYVQDCNKHNRINNYYIVNLYQNQ